MRPVYHRELLRCPPKLQIPIWEAPSFRLLWLNSFHSWVFPCTVTRTTDTEVRRELKLIRLRLSSLMVMGHRIESVEGRLSSRGWDWAPSGARVHFHSHSQETLWCKGSSYCWTEGNNSVFPILVEFLSLTVYTETKLWASNAQPNWNHLESNKAKADSPLHFSTPLSSPEQLRRGVIDLLDFSCLCNNIVHFCSPGQRSRVLYQTAFWEHSLVWRIIPIIGLNVIWQGILHKSQIRRYVTRTMYPVTGASGGAIRNPWLSIPT